MLKSKIESWCKKVKKGAEGYAAVTVVGEKKFHKMEGRITELKQVSYKTWKNGSLVENKVLDGNQCNELFLIKNDNELLVSLDSEKVVAYFGDNIKYRENDPIIDEIAIFFSGENGSCIAYAKEKVKYITNISEGNAFDLMQVLFAELPSLGGGTDGNC